MKLLFLHLSDLHCIDKSSLSSSKIKGIKKAIKALYEANNFDETFLFFTGDLSMSGQVEQFNIVNQFFKDICKYLLSFTNGRRVNLAIVPGNHDINFNNLEQTRENIKTLIDKNKNIALANYINKMDSFFTFASKFNCFYKQSKLVDVIKISKPDFNLKINLINTAPFSVYSKEKNPDNDMGLHYISDEDINLLTSDNDRYDLKITLMHHSPEFFDEESKNKLNDFLKHENGILLLGHEHIDKNITIEEDGKKSKRFTGGPLSDNQSISEFECLIYDTSVHQIVISNHYFWNKKQNIYEANKNTDRVSIESTPKIYKKNFITDLTHDLLLTDVKDFREIFVFPDLKYKEDNNTSSKKISSLEELRKTIQKYKTCIIEGENSIGKTTLAKYLFLESQKNYRPLLFNVDNINDLQISKIIKHIFENEYDHTEYSFSNYEQEDKNLRIAIVDDVDKIQSENLQYFLNTLENFFGHIILMKNANAGYDLISLAKNIALEKDKIISLQIDNMYFKKRQILLKNICAYFCPNNNDLDINNKVNNINQIIVKQINFFQLTPGFIILFAKDAIHTYELGAGKVFNAVFEKNITDTIQTDNTLDVSVTKFLLQKIAYFIHVNRKYPMSQQDFITIIEQYNDEGGEYRNKINAHSFLEKLINVRLLCYANDNYQIKFCYNSYLSYFIAKEVLKQMDTNVFNDLFKNICYGINSDILLFMCYLDENKQKSIINAIIKKANTFFSEQTKELDLSNVNISYLKNIKSEFKLKYPTKKEKEDNVELRNNNEKASNSDKITVNNLYDYENSDLKGKQAIFISSVKYIEIISKLLPDFIHLLNKDECEQIINAVYRYPNKCLYEFLNDINAEIKDLLEDDTIFNYQEYKNELNQIQTFLDTLQRISISLIINLYNMVAKYAGANNTLKAIEKFNYKSNLSYYLINALIYDSLGKTNELGSKLNEICDSSDDAIIKNMCCTIFHNHCLNNSVKNYGDTQKYINKFIEKDAKKAKLTVYRKIKLK